MKDNQQLSLPLDDIVEEPEWKIQDRESRKKLARSRVANYCWDIVHGHKTIDYPYPPGQQDLKEYSQYLEDSQEYFKEEFLQILNSLLNTNQ
jgi:hypothetical protein